MRIIKPQAFIVPESLEANRHLEQIIEWAGRHCYKSEGAICEGSAEKFIGRLQASKHESVLEHGAITVKFIVDRGVSHELVRHRIASFSQESTRYCNYTKDKFGTEITVIEPPFWDKSSSQYTMWLRAMYEAERAYFDILEAGGSPQEARSVLPNSLKTEVIMSANPREWIHVFRMRCEQTAHSQMREVMIPLRAQFVKAWPSIFGGQQ